MLSALGQDLDASGVTEHSSFKGPVVSQRLAPFALRAGLAHEGVPMGYWKNADEITVNYALPVGPLWAQLDRLIRMYGVEDVDGRIEEPSALALLMNIEAALRELDDRIGLWHLEYGPPLFTGPTSTRQHPAPADTAAA